MGKNLTDTSSLILSDGSTWPNPNELKDSFHPAAKAYIELIMGDTNLQQVRDMISLIRQAAGRPRIHRKSGKIFPYEGEMYTWRELAEMGVDGLTREVVVSRQIAGWDMEKILRTPIRKRKLGYKGFKNKADYDALHECTSDQKEVLGL